MKTNIDLQNRPQGYLTRVLVSGGLLLGLAVCGRAQTYSVLHNFGATEAGYGPQCALVQGPDGSFYGTTYSGGPSNCGTIFRVNSDGSGYQTLKHFTGADGQNPVGRLLLTSGFLYGTTQVGGISQGGVLFRISTNGTAYSMLTQFPQNSRPAAGLLLSGSTLYGTTAQGGTYGNVFKINTDGSGYTVIKQFAGTDGAFLLGGLVLAGSTLYGTTESQLGVGWMTLGTVFKVNTDGGGFTVLKVFGFTDGIDPAGTLVLSGSTLYGTTTSHGPSGTYGGGTVFRINTDGSGFTVLHGFTGTNGYAPCGDLILCGSVLFGAASYGGPAYGAVGTGDVGDGTLFKLNLDGSGFTILRNLSARSDGANPQAGLMLSGTTLYGTTSTGGLTNGGTLFEINQDGTGYTVLTHFCSADGRFPPPFPHPGSAGLTAFGSTLYGATPEGGAFGMGTLFSVSTNGSDYRILKSFSQQPGEPWSPQAEPVVWGETVYGTTPFGGSNNSGTLFKVNTDGTEFAVLYCFSTPVWNGSVYINADGAAPHAALTISGTTLYGIAGGGGTNGCGTVFKMNTDGTSYSVLHHFNFNTDGAGPQANLLLAGSTLYGTAGSGGNYSNGIVFKLQTDGSGFTVLKHFDGTNGSGPIAGLLCSGDWLYGTTSYGGLSNYGTVFKVNSDGSGYAVLKNFTGPDGGQPSGSLLLSGSRLFGTTKFGGTKGNGTLFMLGTDGSGFTILKHLAYGEGCAPLGSLAMAGSSFYGVASEGGSLGAGVVFGLSLAPPTVLQPPGSQTAETGSSLSLSGLADGSQPLSYQWLFNGSPVAGCSGSELKLTAVNPSCSGSYVVVVSNLFGAATSAPAMVNVISPVPRRMVPSLTLMGESGESLNLDYTSLGGPAPTWTTFDTITLTNSVQWYFDITVPLPAQRFYRVWQTGTPALPPSLNLAGLVPAITLSGSIGSSLRLDYINQFGPVDAWVTNLATVTLTNTTQLYFDTSVIGQPPRLWRIVPVP